MPLTQKQRDALPGSDFAVPGQRRLPIHDRDHAKMAWSMLEHTKGLSEPEKAEAKRRILRRAKELGIDTADWEAHQSPALDMQPAGAQDGGAMHAMHFEAMALEVPETPDHPNKIPFSGVMTRIDQPSDNPVGGAQGRHVLIPKAVAEAALGTLLGMGVDYTPNLSGHDPTKKIGVITAANIVDDAIQIEGFLYGADFPAVVADIQKRKSQLGFSYEAQATVANWNTDPVEVTRCVFTGAAILFKDKAAYTSTSLEASASQEFSDMDMEQLIAAVKATVTEQLAPIAAEVTALKASAGKLEASNVLHKVKPHADKIRACADGMEADGMGGHERDGHVAVMRRMADKMEAEAVLGKLPHVWRDHDWLNASAEAKAADKVKDDQIAALTAEVAELKAKGFAAAAAPARKTDETVATKPGLQAAGSVDFKANDAARKSAGLSTTARLAALALERAQASH
jgi:hypothetical protein